MDDMKSAFEKLLMLANEKSLVQEKDFILCLDVQLKILDIPPPAVVSP